MVRVLKGNDERPCRDFKIVQGYAKYNDRLSRTYTIVQLGYVRLSTCIKNDLARLQTSSDRLLGQSQTVTKAINKTIRYDNINYKT